MGLFSKFKNKRDIYNSELDAPPMPPPHLKREFSEISDIDEELPKFDEIPKPGPNEKEMVSSFKLPELKEEQMELPDTLPELPNLETPDYSKEEPPLPNLAPKKKGFFAGLLKKKSKEEQLPKIEDLKLEPQETEIPDDLAEFPNLPPMPEELTKTDLKDDQTFSQSLEEPEEIKPEVMNVKEIKPKERKVIVEQETKPKFISLPEFKYLLSDMKKIKSELNSFSETIDSFEEHKTKDQKLFNKWKNSLKDEERKLSFTEKILFKG